MAVEANMTEPRAAARFRVRSTLRSVHRWLGLSLGMLFAVVSVSGSLLLFQPKFFAWAHGELIPEGLDPAPGSLDAWVQNARAAVPDLKGPTFIWSPHVDHNVTDAGMLIFPGRPPRGFGNSGLTAVLVAPDSGSVLGVVDIDSSPAYAPIFFHARLWGEGLEVTSWGSWASQRWDCCLSASTCGGRAAESSWRSFRRGRGKAHSHRRHACTSGSGSGSCPSCSCSPRPVCICRNQPGLRRARRPGRSRR